MSLLATTLTAAATAAAPTARTLGGASPAASGSSLLGMLFALLLVVGLILALGWVLRRMPGSASRSSGALKVVASLNVGARERVVVVDVAGEQLVLGVTGQQIHLLKSLEAPLPVPEGGSSPFAQLLAQRLGGGKR